MFNDKDTIKLNEAYDNISKSYEKSPPYIDGDYSDAELHSLCINAFNDLLKDMYPGDMQTVLPKINWLINLLKRKIQK